MSRRTPPWRHSCVLITGALALTGCSSGSPPEPEAVPQQQVASLTQGMDLSITELKAPDSAKPGQSITVSAKVCNGGDHPVNTWPVRLQVYLSTTASQQVPGPGQPPPTSQMTLGETDVGPVYAGQCVIRSLNVSVSPPSGFTGNGAYYLGAAVDTSNVVYESDETNNGFVKGLLGVGNRPDLVVTRVDAPPSLNPGQSFSATATVCNVGTEPSNGGNVELYLSTSKTLTVPPASGAPPNTQQPAGSAPLNSLAAGQCRAVGINGYASPPPTWTPEQPLYLGAIADPQRTVTEIRNNNNTFVQGLVGMGYRPDLVVRAVKGPASARPGDAITATVTLCNQGTQSSGPVDVNVVMTTATTLAAPGTSPRPNTEAPLGLFNAPPLNAGQCITRSVQGNAYPPPSPPPSGPTEPPVYLGAIVDMPRAVTELREDNNTLVDAVMGLGYRPDLTVVSLDAPSNASSNQDLVVLAKVCNVGTQRSTEVPVEVYTLNEPSLTVVNGPPPPSRMPLGNASVPALEPGECSTRRVRGYPNVPPGTPMPGNPELYLGAIVDPMGSLMELREDNNVSPLPRIGLGSAPDLVVSLTAPASVKPGTSLWTDVKVCNEGTQVSAPPSTVGVFLSTTPDAVSPAMGPPPPTQAPVGTVDVSSLAPGACALYPKSMYVNVPPEYQPGRPLYLVALADMNNQIQETREDNNLRVAGALAVGNGPDLVVTNVTGPASANMSGPITLNVTVCNVGTDPSGPSQVMGVLSSETTLAPMTSPPSQPTEAVVGVVSLPPLAVAQCITTPVSGQVNGSPYSPPDSPRYLGARADASQQVTELREDNNGLVTSRLAIGYGPDLVIRSVTAPATVPQYASFTAQVQVCNEGTADVGPTSLDLVFTTETSLYTPAQGQPPFTQVQMPVGNTQLSPLYVGQCTTVSVQGSAVRPSSATSGQSLYLGAIVDASNSRIELREDNNTLTRAAPISQVP
jgi:subtilase family serine protease